MERYKFDELLATFDNNDPEGLYNFLTDDFEWEMVGDQVIKGKDNVKALFADMEGTKMLSCTKELKLMDGNKASCNGVVEMQDPNGKKTERYYCDLYEFEGNKVKKMTTYIIPK